MDFSDSDLKIVRLIVGTDELMIHSPVAC